MNHRLSFTLATLTSLSVLTPSVGHAAERAPALAALTYSGDQAALEAVDRDIIAAGRDTTRLAAVRDSLLAVLRHRDATFAARQAAAQRLGPVLAALPPGVRASDYRPLPAMLEDPRDCEAARLALDTAPGAVVDQMLLAALEKASGPHRASLLTSIGSRRTALAVPVLSRLAGDTDPVTALAAVRALGEIPTPEADAALKAATGATPAARAAARLRLLPGLPDARARTTLMEIEADASLPASARLAAFRQLLDRDTAAADTRILDALRGADWERKEVALEAITTSPIPARISLLAKGLSAWDGSTQVAVIGILARTGAAAAVPPIAAATRGTSPAVRSSALEALGSLPGTKEIVTLLLEAGAEETEVAKPARRSLARLNGADVSATILAAAESGRSALRAVALESLAARNLTEAIPLLVRCRTDADVAVRNAALSSLAEIAPSSALPDLIAWAQAAEDDTERTRSIRAVVNVILRDPDTKRRAQPLYAQLEAAKPETAERLLPALSRIGGEPAAACAARLANRPDPKLAAAAVAALARWSDASSLSALAGVTAEAAVPAVRESARAAALQTLEKTRDAWTTIRSEAIGRLLGATTDLAARRQLVAFLARANDETAAGLAAGLEGDAALGADAKYAAGAIAANRRGLPKARGNPANGAGNAVDGKTSSRWTVPTLGEEWLEIDYRQSRPFRRVTLDQTGRAADYPEKYSVHVTDDPAQPGAALVQGEGQRNRTVIELPAGTAGRYLIIRNLAERKDSSWSVCEVQLD